MRFLVDADLPRSTVEIIRGFGYEADDVRDIDLGTAKDFQIAHFAQSNGLCLVTGDYDFSDIRNYPPSQYSGIVVLNLPRTTTSAYIKWLLTNLFQQTDIVAQLPGKLAVVEPGKVRIRGDR
jgi:predicted nuclease of predicted toxin-antitoxin system